MEEGPGGVLLPRGSGLGQPPDRRLLHELQMTDTTDEAHGEVYIPYTFILDRDRTIHKVYNGWWFVGRPRSEEIRMDLRALMSGRPDWVYSDHTVSTPWKTSTPS